MTTFYILYNLSSEYKEEKTLMRADPLKTKGKQNQTIFTALGIEIYFAMLYSSFKLILFFLIYIH